MNGPGFLGTNATMLADLTLVAYVLLIAPAMLVGFVFARRKMFVPHHKLMMTTIVIINWLLILFAMAASFVGRTPADRPIPHFITGGLAQLVGTYLVILMWTEKTRFAGILPEALRVKNIKLVMRTTLALWLITVVLGVVIYLATYSPASAASDAPPPVATEEPTDEAPSGDSTDDTDDAADDSDSDEADDDADEASDSDEADDDAADASADEPSSPAATEEPPAPATTEEP